MKQIKCNTKWLGKGSRISGSVCIGFRRPIVPRELERNIRFGWHQMEYRGANVKRRRNTNWFFNPIQSNSNKNSNNIQNVQIQTNTQHANYSYSYNVICEIGKSPANFGGNTGKNWKGHFQNHCNQNIRQPSSTETQPSTVWILQFISPHTTSPTPGIQGGKIKK